VMCTICAEMGYTTQPPITRFRYKTLLEIFPTGPVRCWRINSHGLSSDEYRKTGNQMGPAKLRQSWSVEFGLCFSASQNPALTLLEDEPKMFMIESKLPTSSILSAESEE